MGPEMNWHSFLKQPQTTLLGGGIPWWAALRATIGGDAIGNVTPLRLVASEPAKAMLLGGAPIDGARHIWWNFVSSTKERIEQAKADWRDGRFAKVPGDPEFIPLPDP